MKRKMILALTLALTISSYGFSSINVYAAPEAEATASTTSTKESLVKSTQYGSVLGTTKNSCNVWYSIPYAAAPVEDLRWSSPIDPVPWNDVLDCTSAGNTAIQAGKNYATGETVISGSEDCLSQ